MHAWLCDNPIGPQALTWVEKPTPEPQPGEVRVAVRFAALNFPDLLIVQNKYQMKPPLPFVPGSEFSGVVEAVGSGVTRLKPGMAVASFGGLGAFATHACVDAALVMPLPAGFALDHAAAFICTYATSHHALMDRGALQAGAGLAVAGGLAWLGHRTPAIVVGSVASAIGLAALVSPLGLFAAIERVFAALAVRIGQALTWTLLPAIFYLFFAPFGLLFRRGRRDSMRRFFDRDATSYWTVRGERGGHTASAPHERPY